MLLCSDPLQLKICSHVTSAEIISEEFRGYYSCIFEPLDIVFKTLYLRSKSKEFKLIPEENLKFELRCDIKKSIQI